MSQYSEVAMEAQRQAAASRMDENRPEADPPTSTEKLIDKVERVLGALQSIRRQGVAGALSADLTFEQPLIRVNRTSFNALFSGKCVKHGVTMGSEWWEGTINGVEIRTSASVIPDSSADEVTLP